MTTWRWLARRALTGEWLHDDVPLSQPQPLWALSAAPQLSATIDPEVARFRASDGRMLLDEWGTMLYAEADGQLRWGGIVVSSRFQGSTWSVEAAGVSSYPHGIPYTGEYRQVAIDPADVMRHVWSHVQGYPNGDLGVSVVGSTTARVGTTAEKYELLWWEVPDCGSVIDQLAQECRFDWLDEVAWAEDGSKDVAHAIRVAQPRVGRRREDLSFEQGANITDVVPVIRDGDWLANEVIGVGAGEGRAVLRSSVPVVDGRLRRPAVYSDKSIRSQALLDSLCRSELAARQAVTEIAEIEVVDHPHARIGSWQLGDDILVQATLPWLGDVAIWHRIVAWALLEESRARLTLVRSERYV